MISLEAFIAKWEGKKVDWDGHYGAQCVDLYRQYVQEVLGFPQSPGVAGAKDIWDTYLPEYYDRIPNTPSGVPEPGDIMIWGSKYGQWGHVAIVLSANTSSFTCLSQNDPIGSPIIKKKYTAWGSVLGWLRPKPRTVMYKGYDLTNQDSMKVAVDKLVDILEGKYISISDHQKIINELDAKSTAMAQSYGTEKSILEAKIRTLEGVVESLQNTEHSWADVADKLQRKLVAVLEEFQKADISLSPEMDTDVLTNQVSVYIASIEGVKDEHKLASTALLNASKKVSKLESDIIILKDKLKAKDPYLYSLPLLGFIIKLYKNT
jgi:hypothetical protein